MSVSHEHSTIGGIEWWLWRRQKGEDSLVGDCNRNLKFSTHHQDQSMESSSNERERGVHLHTLVDRERKRSRERVDGVILVVIQITDDPSAEQTAPPRSTHV